MEDSSIIFISHQPDILYFYVTKFLEDFSGAYASILNLNKEKSSWYKQCSFEKAICNRAKLQKRAELPHVFAEKIFLRDSGLRISTYSIAVLLSTRVKGFQFSFCLRQVDYRKNNIPWLTESKTP